MPGVYVIFNLTNGKVYIGQAVDLAGRYKQHWTKYGVNDNHNKYVNNAFSKYGVDGFIFIVLNYIELTGDLLLDIKHLDELEQFYIDYFQAAKPEYGYNILEKAGSTRGASFYQEEEYKDKQKQGLLKYYKENPRSKEDREKLRQAQLKRWVDHPITEQEKINRSNAQLKRYRENPVSEETREKNRRTHSGINNYNYGGANCKKGCEYQDTTPDGRYYFLINMKRYSDYFNLLPGNMIQTAKRKYKQHKGHKVEYAEQWLVDKVKPLMKSGQYWVEIDINGNIIESSESNV